jgi:hypothetical protein
MHSFTEGAGAGSKVFVEAGGQVAVAGETGLDSDCGDILFRVGELSLRMAETLLDDVLRRRAAKSLAEGGEQMVRRHAGELRQVCECDLLAHAVEDELSQLARRLSIQQRTSLQLEVSGFCEAERPKEMQANSLNERLAAH